MLLSIRADEWISFCLIYVSARRHHNCRRRNDVGCNFADKLERTSSLSLSLFLFSPFVEAVILDYLLLNPPTVTSYTHRRFRGFRTSFATNAELIFYARRKPLPSLPNVGNPREASILHTHYHRAFGVKCNQAHFIRLSQKIHIAKEEKVGISKIGRIIKSKRTQFL